MGREIRELTMMTWVGDERADHGDRSRDMHVDYERADHGDRRSICNMKEMRADHDDRIREMGGLGGRSCSCSINRRRDRDDTQTITTKREAQ
jgi:hypothetical protein